MGDAGKLWAVVQREYLERVRTRWFVIATVLGPVLFAAMLFLPAYLASRNTASNTVADIVVLDATNARLGARVADALRATAASGEAPALSARTRVRLVAPGGLAAAESAATRDVARRETQGYLVLGAGALDGARARYAGRNSTSLSDMRQLETAVRQGVFAARLERAGLSAASIDSIARPPLKLATERLTELGRGGSGAANLVFAVGVSFLLYTTIVLYGQNVLRSVIEEKQTRVAEVVISSISAGTLLAGKVIGVGAVGLTQQIIWLGSTLYIGSWMTPALARMSPGQGAPGAAGSASATMAALPSVTPGAVALILLFFLLGYLLFAALYAAVGATVNSEQEAQQAVGPIIVLVVSSAVMIQPVILNPAGDLARIASLVPFSAPVIMPLRMSLVNVPAAELTLAVVGLAAACMVMVGLAARIYRVGLLMYGKRPTLTEVVRWARYQR